MGGAAAASASILTFGRAIPQTMSGSPATYAAGQDLIFESQTGLDGFAEAVVVQVSMQVTPTITSPNKMAYSPLRSFFQRMTLSQGGTTFRDTHPFFYSLRRAMMRRNRQLNYIGPSGQDFSQPTFTGNEYAASSLALSALPALATATQVTVRYSYIIPLRWLRNSTMGMFPVGDSSTPLRLQLFTPTNLVGSDPEANPFLIHPGSTDTVALANATVTAILWYRVPLSYAGGTVPTPKIGTQLVHARQQVAFTGTGVDIPVTHKNLYPHTMFFSIVEDGNADPNSTQSSTNNGLGLMPVTNLTRWRYRLTETDPVVDLDTSDKLLAHFAGWRQQLGIDLPDGIFPYAPILGEVSGVGEYVEPDLELLYQFPNFKTWQNTQTIANVANGTTLNGAAAGLARITELSEYLVGVPY